MRLLLIEDDPLLGAGLRDWLVGDGHRVDWCTGLAHAQALNDEPFDAWLVDWQLPDGSGLDWVRARRARGALTPALMLTARDRIVERVAALDAGVDDYLVKPFAPEELAARLRAVSRRSGAQAAASRARFGAFEVDLAARTAYVEGARVELTAREWGVLEALVLRAGRIVPKDDLERVVMGAGELASNALEVHVSALRRKLGREAIETVRGLGYRIGAAP